MSERRPTRGSGPRSSRGPAGPRVRPRAAGGAQASAGRTTGDVRRPAAARRTRRPRFTGRAAILVLVLAVLTVSYASSMRAYLQQRDHLADLRAQIDATEQDISALEREKKRWDDDAYVEMQARLRFGYVMPGETGYRVLGEDGEPLESPDRLSDPEDIGDPEPTAWWDTAWASMERAGNPEEESEQPPARKIKAPE